MTLGPALEYLQKAVNELEERCQERIPPLYCADCLLNMDKHKKNGMFVPGRYRDSDCIMHDLNFRLAQLKQIAEPKL